VNRPGGLLQGMFIIRYRLPPGHFSELVGCLRPRDWQRTHLGEFAHLRTSQQHCVDGHIERMPLRG
jgi:hypothetical protein